MNDAKLLFINSRFHMCGEWMMHP